MSLYLDKAGWLERISQGKSIGFIIILIGIIGLAFSSYKLYLLSLYSREVMDDDNSESIIAKMKAVSESSTSSESKENSIDELIVNYSSQVEWGNNWVKFFLPLHLYLGYLVLLSV